MKRYAIHGEGFTYIRESNDGPYTHYADRYKSAYELGLLFHKATEPDGRTFAAFMDWLSDKAKEGGKNVVS